MNSMIFALTSSTTTEMSFAEKFMYGGQMLLLGMGAVFAVLLIIYLCLLVFKSVFSKASAPKVKVEPMPVAPMPTKPPSAPTNEEIVAVIAAAIAMAESESSGVKFRVVSFKRV